MGPKDNPDALFAISTTGSCEAIGFMFTLGVCCLVWYTVFLTYCFMRRIKYKITPQNFAKKKEKYFHFVATFLSLGLGLAGVATGNINPQGKGNICGLGPYPVGCDKSPDMVCERGDGKGTNILLTIAGIILIGGFLILVVVLLLFTHHVYREDRTLTIPAREIGNINRSTALRRAQRNNDSPDQESVAQNQIEEGNANIERRKKNKLILTKQALLQSFPP